jgi:hypothetical protein
LPFTWVVASQIWHSSVSCGAQCLPSATTDKRVRAWDLHGQWFAQKWPSKWWAKCIFSGIKRGGTPLVLQVETELCRFGRLHVLPGALHCAPCCKLPKPFGSELYLFFSNIAGWCFVVFKIGRPQTRYQSWRKGIVIEQSKSNTGSFYGVSVLLCLWAWWLYQIESMHALRPTITAAIIRHVTKGAIHLFITFSW